MSKGNLKTQIEGIEAQLRVLKASGDAARKGAAPKGLRALKGALRGRGRFGAEEVHGAEPRFKDDA